MSGNNLTMEELCARIQSVLLHSHALEERVAGLEERIADLENQVYDLDMELERDRPRDYD